MDLKKKRVCMFLWRNVVYMRAMVTEGEGTSTSSPKKSCNTAHVNTRRRQWTTSTCCCFWSCKPFLCSHFLFLYPFRSLTLAAASPFNFYRTPMSSRRLPVSRLTERQEKNRQCTILLSSVFRRMLDLGLVCIFLLPS